MLEYCLYLGSFILSCKSQAADYEGHSCASGIWDLPSCPSFRRRIHTYFRRTPGVLCTRYCLPTIWSRTICPCFLAKQCTQGDSHSTYTSSKTKCWQNKHCTLSSDFSQPHNKMATSYLLCGSPSSRNYIWYLWKTPRSCHIHVGWGKRGWCHRTFNRSVGRDEEQPFVEFLRKVPHCDYRRSLGWCHDLVCSLWCA